MSVRRRFGAILATCLALSAPAAAQSRAAAPVVNGTEATGRETLAPTGVLRAAFLATNPIHGRVNPATSEVTGLVADVVQRLASLIGTGQRLIPCPDAACVTRSLDDGSADIGFLAFDPARAMQVDFVGSLALMRNSYVVTKASPAARSADIDRSGGTVGAVKGQTQQLFVSSALRQAQVRIFDAQPAPDALERLLGSGELSAFAMNRQRALDIEAAAPGLRALPDSFLDVPQAFVVRKGETAKRALLERVAADLRASGFVDASIRKAGLQQSAAVASEDAR